MTRLPRLALVATGGTIAGAGDLSNYRAGTLPAEALLAAVPLLGELASWQIEQPFGLDSRDLTPAHWLQLASRLQALARDESIDGIIITHGTDTLEETACALDMLLALGKPVIITAAMRPATSLSPDGPMNLLQAARVTMHPHSPGRGILIVADDRIIAGGRVVKVHTHMTDAIVAQDGGEEGVVIGNEVVFHRPSPTPRGPLLPIPDPADIPRVDIIFVATGQNPDQIDSAIDRGAKGIVLALPGHGSVPDALLPSLRQAAGRNIMVVRASRVPHGMVARNHNADDDANGWIAAGRRNPLQARVMLILALANGCSFAEVTALFHPESGN